MWCKLDTLTAALLLFSTYTPTLAHPQPITSIQVVSESSLNSRAEFADTSDLWKRKGGGGGGGKGGSSGSSSGSSSSGSSSSGSSSSGSSSSGYVPSNSNALVVLVGEKHRLTLILI